MIHLLAPICQCENIIIACEKNISVVFLAFVDVYSSWIKNHGVFLPAYGKFSGAEKCLNKIQSSFKV